MNLPVLQYKKVMRTNETHKVFLISDLHIGSRDFNKKEFHKIMERTYDKCDKIIIIGDVFDAIFSKDPRYTPGMIAPELAGGDDQMNRAVTMAVGILGPYADKIQLIAKGNHETAILKYNNVDILDFLIRELNLLAPKHPITHGGYRGFIQHSFDVGEKRRKVQYLLFYDHGHGGSSPVTKGMIDINRTKVIIDYDGFFFGHKHCTISDIDSYITVLPNGKVRTRKRISAQVGTFKNLIEDSNDAGFEDVKGFGAAHMGGVLLTLTTRYEDEEYIVDQQITL